MSVGRTLVGASAVLLLCSASALAQRAKPASSAAAAPPGASTTAGSAPQETDAVVQVARFEEDARRAESAAREARARASSLSVVARLARSKVDGLNTADKLEAEEGLAHLQVVIATHEATARSEERSASEHRMNADRMRARITRGDATTSCDPPFWFDPDGRKRWRPECF